MPDILYAGHRYSSEPGETVLDCLLRNGQQVPNSCRNGVCQSCMMKAVKGQPDTASQKELKPQLQQQGYFLSCCCRPGEEIEVCEPDKNAQPVISARVAEKQLLTESIIQLSLETDTELSFHAGQFFNLITGNDLIRSYSIASLPDEDRIEFHIERLPGGAMSGRIFDQLKTGDEIQIQGPHGSCYYLDDDVQKPVLLVGTGTGLAPLYGVLKDALAHGHQGDIHLYQGSRDPAKIYLRDSLFEMAEHHKNFHYTPCLSGPDVIDGVLSGRAADLAFKQHPDLSGYRVYLCGHPDMVKQAKRKAYLAGATLSDIYSDAFLKAY